MGVFNVCSRRDLSKLLPQLFVIAVYGCPKHLSFKSTFWDRRVNLACLVDHLGISSQGQLVQTGCSHVLWNRWTSSRNAGRAPLWWGSTDPPRTWCTDQRC
jgi:hypothetical protein